MRCREPVSAGWPAAAPVAVLTAALLLAWAVTVGTIRPTMAASTTLRMKAYLFTVSPRRSESASSNRIHHALRRPSAPRAGEHHGRIHPMNLADMPAMIC
jgi:hypothetical protein